VVANCPLPVRIHRLAQGPRARNCRPVRFPVSMFMGIVKVMRPSLMKLTLLASPDSS